VKNGNGITALMNEFAATCEPLESGENLLRLIDERTEAHHCECHIKGSKLIQYGTTNVPLDPEEPDYRANREIVEDDVAFQGMKDDAKQKRSFSNIVLSGRRSMMPIIHLKSLEASTDFRQLRKLWSKA